MAGTGRKVVVDLLDSAPASKISVWIGDFAMERELSEYLDDAKGFGADFGCTLPSNMEFAIGAEPWPIKEMLEGFSLSPGFAREVLAREDGEVMAHCAVLAFGCDYTALGIRPKPGRLRFSCVVSLYPRDQKPAPARNTVWWTIAGIVALFALALTLYIANETPIHPSTRAGSATPG